MEWKHEIHCPHCMILGGVPYSSKATAHFDGTGVLVTISSIVYTWVNTAVSVS